MDQDSTETEQPVDSNLPPYSLELPTGHFLVEHSLNFDTEEGPRSYLLWIVAPSLKAARGISQVVFASFWSTVSQDQLNGDSQ